MSRASLIAPGLAVAMTLLLPGLASARGGGQAPRVLTLQPPIEREVHGNYMGVPGIEPGILTEGFLSSHPDMRWRREGLYSYNQEEYDIAMDQFLRAARYADKPSQAMIAEMYWKGIGVPRDRELGYAWMDLAAERTYPNFVIVRERYWARLDARQRRNAIGRGQPLLAEYGDDIATPRRERTPRNAKPRITGSQPGRVSPGLSIIAVPGPMSGMSFGGEKIYKAEYRPTTQIGRASGREKVCQYVSISV